MTPSNVITLFFTYRLLQVCRKARSMTAGRKRYCEKHPDRRAVSIKRYEDSHKEQISSRRKKNRPQSNLQKKNRYWRDESYRLLVNIRTRINRALSRGTTKSAGTLSLLGCTIEQYRKHLSDLFSDGMSWSNYGEWEVDHVRPCADFDLRMPDNQRACFHFSNTQPLWKEKNLQKGDKCSN